MVETTERLVQTWRRRLEAVRRRQQISRRQAHEYAARRLDAWLVSGKDPNVLKGNCVLTTGHRPTGSKVKRNDA